MLERLRRRETFSERWVRSRSAAHTWQRVKARQIADEIIARSLGCVPSSCNLHPLSMRFHKSKFFTARRNDTAGRFQHLSSHVKEQSAWQLLFAQPLMLQRYHWMRVFCTGREPETRLKAHLRRLRPKSRTESTGVLSDHLALLPLYFRPEKQRSGKILLSANRKSLDNAPDPATPHDCIGRVGDRNRESRDCQISVFSYQRTVRRSSLYLP